jgi:CubicO group peptidase (beta-lactamase class C family)
MPTKMPIALIMSLMVLAPANVWAEPVADAKSRADAVMAKFAKPGEPGCAAGVFQNGAILYQGAFGLANMEHTIPIYPQHTVFEVGSVSKQFTAASILLLAQDGQLKLTDDIRKFLPEIPDTGRIITIDHLLHHTSGLRDYIELRWMMGMSWWAVTTEEDALALIAKQKALNFPPGTRYGYSNTNYFLLSQIVKRVSGKPLADFAKERLFTPLGMTNTYFSSTLGKVTPNHASGYALQEDGSFEARSVRSLAYGDSRIQTTIPDLAKWQRNFDDPKVGGAPLIKNFEQNGVLNDGRTIDMARGLEVLGRGSGYRGQRTVMHQGATWDGFRAEVMRLPNLKLSIAILCNSDRLSPSLVRNEIADIFLEGKIQEPPRAQAAAADREPAPDAVAKFLETNKDVLGVYWNREDMLVRRIELADGKLWYVRSPQSRTELAPESDGSLRFRGAPVRLSVEPPSAGPQRIRLISNSPATFEKVEPASTDLKTASEFVGVYANPIGGDMGDARFVFALKDGNLQVVTPPDGIGPLKLVFKDAYLNDLGNVFFLFQRDAAGRVTSVLYDNDRVRNLVLTRQ